MRVCDSLTFSGQRNKYPNYRWHRSEHMSHHSVCVCVAKLPSVAHTEAQTTLSMQQHSSYREQPLSDVSVY